MLRDERLPFFDNYDNYDVLGNVLDRCSATKCWTKEQNHWERANRNSAPATSIQSHQSECLSLLFFKCTWTTIGPNEQKTKILDKFSQKSDMKPFKFTELWTKPTRERDHLDHNYYKNNAIINYISSNNRTLHRHHWHAIKKCIQSTVVSSTYPYPLVSIWWWSDCFKKKKK